MTAQEMSIAFSLEANKVNSKTTKKYLEEEKQYYLNKAQDRFIAMKLRKKENVQQYDIIDAEVIDTLIVLTRNLDYVNDRFTLPTELEYFVRGSLKSSCGLVPINLIKTGQIDQINQTPFYRSSIKKCNAELAKNEIVCYPHKNTESVSVALVTYIRKHTKIDLALNNDCELRDTYHSVIVEMAVALAKIDNASPDAQLKESEIKTNSIKLG